MKDRIASELYTLVALLKERDEGVSIRTVCQLGKVYELLEGRDDIRGAERLRAVYQHYRDALDIVHVSVEIYLDRDEALAASTGTRRSRRPRRHSRRAMRWSPSTSRSMVK